MSFKLRDPFLWQVRTRTHKLGSHTILMGILNVTPDSFSDGGEWLGREAAVAHALEMLEEGADVIDVGGESTRPNATAITPAEEQARVMPVLRAILDARPDAVLSIDTYHAETARMAVEAGAEIVNDVSGHLWDREMSGVCADLGCGVVLMHTRGRSGEWPELSALVQGEVAPMVMDGLRARAKDAMNRGVKREAIVLDPGFGFGKAFEENFPLLAQFERFGELEFPLLAGISRKGFLKRALAEAGGGSEDLARALVDATVAANTAAVLAGAHILRVHDVAAAKNAAVIADRILAATMR